MKCLLDGVKYTVHANKCALEWKVLQSYLLKLNLMEKTENENKNKDKKTHRKSEPTYQSCKSWKQTKNEKWIKTQMLYN